jgi:hypothetical protein
MPAISSKKPYRIGRSSTGLGLFATKPIKKGTKIVRYFGPLLDCKKKKHDAVENKYLFELNDRWTTPASRTRSPTSVLASARFLSARSRTSSRARRSATITVPITSRPI